MNIKDSIGLRIKTERERQQMSREVLCLDGAELTVRQLIRIEKGESLPSLDKLSYIAKRLGKSMTDLLDHDNITIPDEYYEMKNRLIKFPTYRNPERIKYKLALIEEVYEKFFELLPEEELLTLDILENILSFTSWEESPKVEEIYEDLFEQVKRKKKFSTNDLLVIDYYFFHLYGRKQFDKKLFERIVKRVLNQEIWTDDVYNIVLFNDLMAIAALKIFHNSFSDFLTVVDKALAVIEKSQFYSYKPSVFVLKAKYELLHKGKLLAQEKNCELTAVIIGSNVDKITGDVIAYGADQVILVDDPVYEYYSTDGYAITMTALIREYQPETVLIGATDNGRDLAPRIACNLQTGLTADCTEIGIDEKTGCIAWTRPTFGGNLMATIICPERRPQMGTVRPGVFHLGEYDEERKRRVLQEDSHEVEIIYESPKVTPDQIRTKLLKRIKEVTEIVDLESAEIIVAGGKGIGSEDGFRELRKFADAIGGVIACSRAVVEAGWLPQHYQVGQSGKTVTPRVYFAVGISGAIQHLAGIAGVDTVIAVNTDPEAEIFKRADYGIVGDYKEILPLLTK